MKLLVALFLILLLATAAMGDFTGYVYMLPYGSTKTVEWEYPASDMGEPDGYEFYVQRLEDGRKIAQGSVAQASVAIRFKTHGHDVVWVRAFKTVDGVRQVGNWASSLEIGKVNGRVQGWAVYVMQP